MSVPLIASHDERGSATDGAKATYDQLVNVIAVWDEITCAFLERMAMIVARVIAVSSYLDVGVFNLVGKRFAFKGAVKVIGHKSLIKSVLVSNAKLRGVQRWYPLT